MKTASRNPDVWEKAQHFDIQKHWRKLGPIFRSDAATAIWQACMWEFGGHKLGNRGFNPDFKGLDVNSPSDYESSDWRCDRGPGRPSAILGFACARACHWVADLALYVAVTAYPSTPWRLLNSAKHTTVWNGCVDKPVLFDINFYCLGISAQKAMKLASQGRELKAGQYLKAYLWRTPQN